MVTGNDRTGLKCIHILNPLDILDDQLLVGDNIVQKASCDLVGQLRLNLTADLSAQIVNIVRHQFLRRWVFLHILIKTPLSLQLRNLFQHFKTILRFKLSSVQKVQIIIFIIDLILCRHHQTIRRSRILRSLLISIIFQDFKNLFITNRLLSILPEICSHPAILVMPGF